MAYPNEHLPNDLERRLAALERSLAQQARLIDQQAQEIANLGMWHEGRKLSFIARRHPKTRSVIFLHPDFFGDNVKYAFLGFLPIAAQHGIACHFLINDDRQRAAMMKGGLPVLPPFNEWTLDHVRLLLNAKVVVACDHFTPHSWSRPLPYFLLQGARLIQLWHGIPLKEIGLLTSRNPAQALEHDYLRLSSTGPADVFVAPGANMQDQWRQWFSFRQFAVAGYPRNGALLHAPTAQELINVDSEALKDIQAAFEAGRKTIFYAPTFRDYIGSSWLEKTDFAAFAAWCREKNYFLMAKLHPVEEKGSDRLRASMPNIRFARPDSDIYPLLRFASMLVTDYSSIALDFLLLDRPMVFYWPNHADYLSQCRQLLPDFEHFIAGDKATDSESLCRATERALTETDSWALKRQALRQVLFDDHEDANAGRISQLILDQLEVPEKLPAKWGL